MSNEFKKHKKSDGIKWVAVTLAIILLATALTATITKGFKDWNPFGWFDKQAETPENVTDGDGNILDSNTVYAMPKSLAYNSPSAQSTAADGVNLVAKVIPEEAFNPKVDWIVTFVNPASAWATGKTVSDYVTATPTEDGSLQANVKCLAAFGEQIKITVTSRDYKSAKAECLVDYVKKLSSYDLRVGDISIAGDKINTVDIYSIAPTVAPAPFTVSYVETVGTKSGSYTAPKVSYCFSVAFVEYFLSILDLPVGDVSITDIVLGETLGFGRTFFDNLYGNTEFDDVHYMPISFNILVRAFKEFQSTNPTLPLFEINVINETIPSFNRAYSFHADMLVLPIKVEDIEIDGSLEF